MNSTDQGSVTHWVRAFAEGDDQAGHELWSRYFERMLLLARHKLGQTCRRFADEEDAAVSAFDSFSQGLRRGCFPEMQNRDDLWSMLVVITLRKAIDQVEHECRQKRGGGHRRALNEQAVLQELLSREPFPETQVAMADEFDHLLTLLSDDDQRQLVVFKLLGHSNTKCADLLGCARVTVQRMLKLIRQTWQPEMPL